MCGEGEDDEDMVRIRKFIFEGCGCQQNCTKKIEGKEERVLIHIFNMREMDKSDKDMYIMGSLAESSEKENTKRGKKRLRSTLIYTYLDTKICKKTFMLIYDIGKHSLQNIISHLKTHGTIPRTHGNIGRKPKHSLKFDDIKAAIQFVMNYSEQSGFQNLLRHTDGTMIRQYIYLVTPSRNTFISNIQNSVLKVETAPLNTKRFIKFGKTGQSHKDSLSTR